MTTSRSLALLLALLAATPAAANDDERLAGDVLQYALPLTGAAVAFARDDRDGIWQQALEFAAAAATTEVAKRAFKHTSWGERPDGGEYSFPSGHATHAFAGAAFLERRYGWTWGAPAYAVASYVAYTRVDADRHRWRDVIAGAAVSIAWSRWLVTPLDNGRTLSLAPGLTRGGASLSLQYAW